MSTEHLKKIPQLCWKYPVNDAVFFAFFHHRAYEGFLKPVSYTHLIRHIREKIEINPREPRYLKVVWGVGYKIEKQ